MVAGGVWDDWDVAFGRDVYLCSGHGREDDGGRLCFWRLRILYDGDWVFHRLFHCGWRSASALLPDESDFDLHLFGAKIQCGGA